MTRSAPVPGEHYGYWTVRRDAGRDHRRRRMVEVECLCGTVRVCSWTEVKNGGSTSCGCKRKKVIPTWAKRGVLDNGHDGRRITRNARPTPGGTLDADPDVAAYMRRHGVTRIEAVEISHADTS